MGVRALFLLEAAAFFRYGVLQGRLSFAPWLNRWAVVSWVLIGYALVYPGLNAAQHLTWRRIPTFGVPCPTTLFTAGLLMLTAPRLRMAIIPVTWSMIAGSAAFVLGVRPDYALPVAGTALAAFSLRRQIQTRRDGAESDIGARQSADEAPGR